MLFIVLPWPSYRRCSWYVPDSAIAIVLEVELGGGVLLSAPRSRGLPAGAPQSLQSSGNPWLAVVIALVHLVHLWQIVFMFN